MTVALAGGADKPSTEDKFIFPYMVISNEPQHSPVTTCSSFGAISQEAVQSHVTAESGILLLGAGQRQKHTEHGHILVIILGFLYAIRSDRLGL